MKPWVKLHTEILDDRKMSKLTDRQFRVWINLLAMGGIIDRDGALMATEDIAYRLRQPDAVVAVDLAALASLDMLYALDGIWYITHWEARQPTVPSDLPEATRERKRRQREREKATIGDVTTRHDVTENVTAVTTIEEKRIEERRREEIAPPPTATGTPSAAFVAWGATHPLVGITPADREALDNLIELYGDESVTQAIYHCHERKTTPYVNFKYLAAVLSGWQMDGKLGGQAQPGSNGTHVGALPSTPF